jgi:two-component system chemotaxis response regulator CheY
VAVNGDEASTAFILAHNEKDPYEVIFLDIVIPGKNGFEVLEYIRSYEKEQHIEEASRIIITSALDDQNQVLNAYRKKCDSYLIKPISFEKITEACSEAGLKMDKDLSRSHIRGFQS